MSELLNQNELAVVVAGAPVTDGHAALLDALNARYPNAGFQFVAEREGRTWQPGIVDQDGKRVADSLVGWLDEQLATAGGDAGEVWRRHKDSGLIRTEWVGSVIYLTAPYASEPDAFFQLEIMVGEEMTTRQMFDPKPWETPADRSDLVSGGVQLDEDEQRTLSPPRYQLDALINVRRFLRELVEIEKAERLAQLPEMEKKILRINKVDSCEMLGPGSFQIEEHEEIVPFLEMFPGWLDYAPPAARLFQDWQESSPGRLGLRFCDHWFVQNNDYTNKDGKRSMYLCPQWADADGGLDLPKIDPDWDASPYGVMESLSEFDKAACYPFAFFFYMIHGNRITSSAGNVVAKAIKEGKMHPLPECDEKVLLRWYERQYGF